MRVLSVKQFIRYHRSQKYSTYKERIQQHLETLDWSKLEKSLILRGQNFDTSYLRKLINRLDSANDEDLKQLENELLKLPNYVHPRVWDYGTELKEIYRYTPDRSSNNSTEFSDICKHLNLFRMDHLGNYAGHKSYYLFGKLAELEQALLQYSIGALKKNNFNLLSVPDILPVDIVKGCGMQTETDRTQVYKIESEKCLSGTAEMALAGYFSNTILKESELPIKCAAVSRCYRAETSGLTEEKGIYRVHQFTKVEMFSVCSQNQSEIVLESFKDLEMELFRNLNLNYRLLDMPPSELGASAYQKYDIEAWMPGRKQWGEISSCSNCTDYQSKRLNIRYITNNNDLLYAHTVNGTASAIPRLLISLIESNQVDKNKLTLPDILRNYLRASEMVKEKHLPEIKLVKHFKSLI